MKVVINKCFGGFGLSAIALKRYAELSGRECYFFTNPRQDGKTVFDKYAPIDVEHADSEFIFFAFDIPNPNGVASAERNKHFISDSEIPRDDKNLVRVVEELGKAANGTYADLKVVEIPDGVDWGIDEYDGLESVHERHQVWS